MAPEASRTHAVLIPSYNTGARLRETLREARANWAPVYVVIDGSDDGSGESALAMASGDPLLRVRVLDRNRGKGAAILRGLEAVHADGFSHVLTMDADGQHPADRIGDFMRASRERPWALILGRPVFDASAPKARVYGRRISNSWVDMETLAAGVGDSLFGFRVYPVAALLELMRTHRFMRRFDFDAEAVVRLCWAGWVPVNLDARVRYLTPEQGGVSHFRYLRDNLILSRMHFRLFRGFVWRLPRLIVRRCRGEPPFGRPEGG